MPSWLTYTNPRNNDSGKKKKKVVSQNLKSLHLVQDSSGELVSGGLTTHVVSPCFTTKRKMLAKAQATSIVNARW